MKNRKITFILTLFAVFVLSVLLLVACGGEKISESGEIPQGKEVVSYVADENGKVGTNPYISWTKDEAADAYFLQLSETEDFSVIVESGRTDKTSFTPASTLKHDTKYYLRLYAQREKEGKMYAFSQVTSSFTTVPAHATAAPDYTRTRTIFDFEEYTTETFGQLFKRNAGGDEMTSEIVEGAGVDGSKALKLSYTKGNMGWAAVACETLPPEKKVWSGTTGIRLWIRAADDGVVNFSVKIGKRGYQQWSKVFTVKSAAGCYVTIPYEVMEDQGGGDGIWELSGMVRMQFTMTGSSGAVFIDNVTIGSSEEYRSDTTALAAKYDPSLDYTSTRTVFDFEKYTTETFGTLFAANAAGDDISATVEENVGAENSKALILRYVKGGKGWGQLATNKLPASINDWTGTTGIGLYVKNVGGNTATLSIKIARSANEYFRVQISVRTTEGVHITVPFSAMEKVGAMTDLSSIPVLQFSLTETAAILIDDFTVGSSEEYQTDTSALAGKGRAPGILETFEGEDIVSLLSTNFVIYGADASATEITEEEGNHALKIKCSANGCYVQLKNAAYGLKDFDYSDVTGITFRVRLSQVKEDAYVRVKFGSYGNVYSADVALSGVATAGEFAVIRIAFADLHLFEGSSGALNFGKIDTLQVFVNNSQYCFATLDDIGFYTEAA